MLLGVLLLLQTGAPSDRSRIDTIVVENRNVFDEDDPAPGWMANLANGLHIRRP